MLPYKIYTRRKIFNYYTGLSFFIFIWITRQPHDQTQLVRHEKIHFWQQVEMLFIFHWIFYAFFYVVSRLNGHGHYIAYRYNPFEIEAFDNDYDAEYLLKRRPYAWVKCVAAFRSALKQDLVAPPDKKIIWNRSQRS